MKEAKVAAKMENRGGRFPWRAVGWGAAALILLHPLVARQFTDQVKWDAFDFVTMGALLTCAGLGIELAARTSARPTYRLASAVAISAAFLLIVVNLAVGFLGSEDNPANLMFFGVLVVALTGSSLARFRPVGMMKAMIAAAAAQVFVGLTALIAGLGSAGSHGIYEVALGTSLFATLWLVSAWLFRRAA
jgi:hypothetical protein